MKPSQGGAGGGSRPSAECARHSDRTYSRRQPFTTTTRTVYDPTPGTPSGTSVDPQPDPAASQAAATTEDSRRDRQSRSLTRRSNSTTRLASRGRSSTRGHSRGSQGSADEQHHSDGRDRSPTSTRHSGSDRDSSTNIRHVQMRGHISLADEPMTLTAQLQHVHQARDLIVRELDLLTHANPAVIDIAARLARLRDSVAESMSAPVTVFGDAPEGSTSDNDVSGRPLVESSDAPVAPSPDELDDSLTATQHTAASDPALAASGDSPAATSISTTSTTSADHLVPTCTASAVVCTVVTTTSLSATTTTTTASILAPIVSASCSVLPAAQPPPASPAASAEASSQQSLYRDHLTLSGTLPPREETVVPGTSTALPDLNPEATADPSQDHVARLRAALERQLLDNHALEAALLGQQKASDLDAPMDHSTVVDGFKLPSGKHMAKRKHTEQPAPPDFTSRNWFSALSDTDVTDSADRAVAPADGRSQTSKKLRTTTERDARRAKTDISDALPQRVRQARGATDKTGRDRTSRNTATDPSATPGPSPASRPPAKKQSAPRMPPIACAVSPAEKPFLAAKRLQESLTGPLRVTAINDRTSFYTSNATDHATLYAKLTTLGYQPYTALRPDERTDRVVLRRLPKTVTPEEVSAELQQIGVSVASVVRMRTSPTATTQPFLITLTTLGAAAPLYPLKSLGCWVAAFERYRGSGRIPQCYRCQGLGHSSIRCQRDQRCFKCAGPHLSRDCTATADERRCCNCGGPHIATSQTCPNIQAYLRRHPLRTATPSGQPTPTTRTAFPTAPDATSARHFPALAPGSSAWQSRPGSSLFPGAQASTSLPTAPIPPLLSSLPRPSAATSGPSDASDFASFATTIRELFQLVKSYLPLIRSFLSAFLRAQTPSQKFDVLLQAFLSFFDGPSSP